MRLKFSYRTVADASSSFNEEALGRGLKAWGNDPFLLLWATTPSGRFTLSGLARQKKWDNKAIPEEFYFSADDVGDEARLLGLIAFHFAYYGAGTVSSFMDKYPKPLFPA